jgi:hypothetical protein
MPPADACELASLPLESGLRPRRVADYRIEELDGELLIYRFADTTVLYCNDTASLVWHLCDGDTTIAEMTALLGAAYPDAAADIPSQLDETLADFLREGIITLA